MIRDPQEDKEVDQSFIDQAHEVVMERHLEDIDGSITRAQQEEWDDEVMELAEELAEEARIASEEAEAEEDFDDRFDDRSRDP
jgi:GAF domain-containing protein